MDATNLIAKMDAWDIDISCILPVSEHPEGGYLEAGTRDVLAACAQYPLRLIPFCLIDPRFGNSRDMDFKPLLQEYMACGCRGLGEFLPKLDFNDELCLNLYRQAGELELPVLFDMQDSADGYGLRDNYGLPKLEDALMKCPGTVFVGHGPTFWAEISADVPEGEGRYRYNDGPVVKGGAVPRLMRRYPNLWADTSAGSGYNAITRDPAFGIEFLDEFQDKIMFGTDSCLRSDLSKERPVVRLFQAFEEEGVLSKDALEKIKWRNCARLLRLKDIAR